MTLTFLAEARLNPLARLRHGGREVDVVEQRGFRWLKKWWREPFGRIPTLIFYYDLARYDEFWHYPTDELDFKKVLHFFGNLAEGRMFADTTIVLFLVNVTEFEEKLKRVPLSRYFQRFKGGNNAQEAAAHIRGEFAVRVKSGHRLRSRICDYSDPLNVDFLFASVDHATRQRAIRDRFKRGK